MSYDYAESRLKATPVRDGTSSFAPHVDKAKGKADKATPRTPSLDHLKLQPYWADVEAIRGGTKKMRELGEAYLPCEPQEDPEAYARRLSRAVLSPIYARLVRGLAGMILRKPVNVPDAPEEVVRHLDNLDLQGSDLQQFSQELLTGAIDHGYGGIWVDYPRAEGITNRAEEVAAGVRPYWNYYPASQILSLKWQQQGSNRYLKQIRLLQHVTEADGDWGEKSIEQVFVCDRDGEAVTWRSFRENEETEKWEVHEQGTISLSEIPFAIFYSDYKRRTNQPPPMSEVVALNIRHYQVSADQDNSIHVASVPRLFLFGVAPEDVAAIGGVGEAICIAKEGSRAEWLAPDVSAFEPNEKRLDRLEAQMQTLGLTVMLSQKASAETADSKRMDRVEGDSQLAVIAQSLQQALDEALKFHAAYLGESVVLKAQVNRDFDLSTMDSGMISALTGVVNAAALTKRTFLGLLKEAEIGLPDDFDVEAELSELESEFTKQSARPMVGNALRNPLDIMGADEE